MNKTLDNFLCETYPRIFSERHLTPMESCMARGFECGNGWFPLINMVCHKIQQHIDSTNKYSKETRIPQFVAKQVKEKFGSLRFYFEGGDLYCDSIVCMAESMSYQICEICGAGGVNEVGLTQGWLQTICSKCSEMTKREIVKDNEIAVLLEKAVKEDQKKIKEFYASR